MAPFNWNHELSKLVIGLHNMCRRPLFANPVTFILPDYSWDYRTRLIQLGMLPLMFTYAIADILVSLNPWKLQQQVTDRRSELLLCLAFVIINLTRLSRWLKNRKLRSYKRDVQLKFGLGHDFARKTFFLIAQVPGKIWKWYGYSGHPMIDHLIGLCMHQHKRTLIV